MTPITAEEAAQRAAAAARDAAHGRGRTDDDVEAMIERFGRHADGYFHARIVVGGRRFYLHRRYGSWLAPGTWGGRAVLKEPEAVLGSQLGQAVKYELSHVSQKFHPTAEEVKTDDHAASDAGGDDPAGRDDGLPEGGDQGHAPDEVPPDGA